MGKGNGYLVADRLKSCLGLEILSFDRVCMGCIEVDIRIIKVVGSREFTSLVICDESSLEVNS